MKKACKILITVLLLITIPAAAFLIYLSVYYHAEDKALDALISDGTVSVSKTDFGWFFDGPSEDTAMVFYPGAKVEETSYAPLLKELASRGVDVFLVKMPFRMAFFDVDAAEEIFDMYDYERWYLGGHSLGGAMAAYQASEDPEDLTGIVLLASFPTREVPGDLEEILIVGSEDQVVDWDKIEAGREYAPDDYHEYIIEGGNHALFGCYGQQRGDGTATVTDEVQISETVDFIISSIG